MLQFLYIYLIFLHERLHDGVCHIWEQPYINLR